VFRRSRAAGSSPDVGRLRRQEREGEARQDAKDLRIAIIHEDGAYGVDVSKGNEEARRGRLQHRLKEGYAATRPTWRHWSPSSAGPPDIIFPPGYNPTRCSAQAREQGLRFSA